MATWAQQNATTVQILAVVLAGLSLAVLAVNAGLAIYKAATVAATAVTWLLGVANIAAWDGWSSPWWPSSPSSCCCGTSVTGSARRRRGHPVGCRRLGLEE